MINRQCILKLHVSIWATFLFVINFGCYNHQDHPDEQQERADLSYQYTAITENDYDGTFVCKRYGYQIDFPELPNKTTGVLFVGLAYEYEDGTNIYFANAIRHSDLATKVDLRDFVDKRIEGMESSLFDSITSKESVVIDSIPGIIISGFDIEDPSLHVLQVMLPVYDELILYTMTYIGTDPQAGRQFINSFRFIDNPGTWDWDANNPLDVQTPDGWVPSHDMPGNYVAEYPGSYGPVSTLNLGEDYIRRTSTDSFSATMIHVPPESVGNRDIFINKIYNLVRSVSGNHSQINMSPKDPTNNDNDIRIEGVKSQRSSEHSGCVCNLRFMPDGHVFVMFVCPWQCELNSKHRAIADRFFDSVSSPNALPEIQPDTNESPATDNQIAQ
jgi:hypothetical protein